MKIYLAGSCGSERRSYMVSVGEELRALGFEVYCPFELKIENAWDMSQEDWAQKVFNNDILAINSCDVMVMVTPGRQSTAGTNWEQGYAYALGKKIFVFQYTEDQTSLMTYCGATNFINMNKEFILSPKNFGKYIANSVYEHIYNDIDKKHKCYTVLT